MQNVFDPKDSTPVKVEEFEVEDGMGFPPFSTAAGVVHA